ncbi:MAG: FGGY-family carbohydrate kinase [Oscillospiraceae bacterium]|nr:FGGY-family carbohydrate kinase [Oscillospiraceae bacterium]
MEKRYLLGFDVGTYESKGVICDYQGNIVAKATSKHLLSHPKPGWAEHDPINDWWRDFVTVIRKMFDESGISAEEIGAIGISAICAAIVPVDEHFNPLRNAILYGIDSRSVPQCEELNVKIPPEIMSKMGGPCNVEHFAPKILWIKENEPEVFESAKMFTFDAGWLVGKLTGQNVADKYSAMSTVPLIDQETGEWVPEMCEYVCPPEMLPRVTKSTYEIVGTVTEKAAEATGLAAGIPVTCGTTDAGAEAVSIGVIEPGDAMLMYGSTAFYVVVSENEKARKLNLPKCPYTIDGVTAIAGGMATTGSLTRWLLDTTARELVEDENNGGPSAYSTLFKEAEDVPVGSDGLVCLPYFMGERMPIMDPKAKGTFFGLNLGHTRGHLVRSVFEGIAFGIEHNLRYLRENGVEVNTLTAVGGGTKAPLWLQIVSDVCNVRQIVPEETIGASYGDALMAGLGIGVISSPTEIKKMIKVKKIIKPDAERHLQYEKYNRIYHELYERNADLMHELWREES